MSRSDLLRASIACLAIVPTFTACSMLPGSEKIVEAVPGQSAASQSGDQGDSQNNDGDNKDGDNKDDRNDNSDDSDRDNSDEPSDDRRDSSSQGSSSNSGGKSTQVRQRLNVPAGSGIQNLELVEIQGGPTSTGSYGRITAVFKATTDRPMSLNLRIRLFDASGKEIAENTGLTSVYTVGSHDLVTSNLIKLPKGAQPKTFKASLIDKTDLTNGFEISKISRPQVDESSKSRGVQVLTGTATTNGPVKGSVTANGACVTSDGKIYHGSDGLNDNPNQGDSVDYEIPMYDAKGVDLSDATCYVSA
ncbi:hypothetical protein [Luteococcus sp. OSA5]|uniref:hypothetical protein n=1 Tax=Luteococcus sp. OSA5 TaxID=3401630 RepID=UPI003B43C647